MAIRQIKSREAAVPDNIPTEALKSDTEVTAKMLPVLFRKIRKKEQVPPTDWKELHLINIPKKEGLSKCENYRGIKLLSVPGEVFSRELLSRIKDSTLRSTDRIP
ncbi:unnamed protein product [Schistosoma mattheei]|uniref:Uncharacterized protein n=1 Tax=Schistosoma mattheei TaxID=31246 RepID=A0A183NQZ7_9TREM|nr:unnamed protein product [Schistosoma mattheei]